MGKGAVSIKVTEHEELFWQGSRRRGLNELRLYYRTKDDWLTLRRRKDHVPKHDRSVRRRHKGLNVLKDVDGRNLVKEGDVVV